MTPGDGLADRPAGGAEAAYRVWAPGGLPEVREGDDLAKLIAAAEPGLADGDVVLVTSKIVSKAEGGSSPPATATPPSTPRRCGWWPGAARCASSRTCNGSSVAAAGVDASNTPAGTVLLLPEDPRRLARAIRAGLRDALGVTVGVVVTDTFGRPWRSGLTDVAISGRCGSWTTCAAAPTPTETRSSRPSWRGATNWPPPGTS